MAGTKQIPWAEGGGNLTILYLGDGTGPLILASDTENRTGATRRLNVTLSTLGGNPPATAVLVVSQESVRAYVEDGELVLTAAAGASVSGGTLSLPAASASAEGGTLVFRK